jgi:23S rRNA (uracil1939-C5)-methyltransferase
VDALPSVKLAHACTLENADLNRIADAAFFAGNVGQVVEGLRDSSGDPDVVVVDPPRAGLPGKALRRLGRIGARRVATCRATRRRSPRT